ncbi:MAG TPA: DinB family protein [Gemmatimonadales bacterium]|nr:DinB family protein [Gemmatimonadales bacterium]
MSPATLLDLFAWDTWANQKTLSSLRPAVTAAPKAGRLAAHIAATELLWLARIHARPSPVPVWPDVGLDETARLFADAANEWKAYLGSMTVAEESRQVWYVNTKGESFRNSTNHIATHVVFHSHYHRGQIAALVRAAGHEPAYTDFIHAVRSNAFTPKEVVRD